MDMQALHAALAPCTCCSSTLCLSIAAARSARSANSLLRMQLSCRTSQLLVLIALRESGLSARASVLPEDSL